MNTLLCQTVLVCPACPSSLEKAWIVIIDIVETDVCEFTTVEVCNADHFIVLPVRCRNCRDQELAQITSGEITSEQWLIDVPYDKFYKVCRVLLENLSWELRKLYVIPRSYDGVPIYSYSILKTVRVGVEDGVYEVSSAMVQKSSRRALDVFFGY
jgi:hypothetical protein